MEDGLKTKGSQNLVKTTENLQASERVKAHLVKEVLDVIRGEFLLGVYDAVQVCFHEIGHDVDVFELLR